MDEETELRFIPSRLILLLFFVVAAGSIWLVDSRSGNIFAVVTGVVAFIFTILPPRRIRGRCIHPLIVAPVAWILSLVVVEIVLPPRCNVTTVMRGAVPVIQRLGAFRDSHGRYPDTVSAAGVKMPWYRCGTYEYTLNADGSCELRIGDYAQDGFTAWWQSDTHEWYVDN